MDMELVTLIIGTVLGAVITFSISRLEKFLEQKKGKEHALMCLEIELRPINSYINNLLSLRSKLSIPIPNTDIPEIEISSQVQQFIYYKGEIAEKIYDLSTYLRSANEHRKMAFNLLNNPTDPEFMKNDKMFFIECEESKKKLA